jgi:hypothetical protein
VVTELIRRCTCRFTCIDEDVKAVRATYSSELPVSFVEMDITEGGDLPQAQLLFSQDVLQVRERSPAACWHVAQVHARHTCALRHARSYVPGTCLPPPADRRSICAKTEPCREPPAAFSPR